MSSHVPGPETKDNRGNTNPKTDPRCATIERGLGIDEAKPTPLGRWLVYVGEATHNMDLVRLSQEFEAEELAQAWRDVEQLWEASATDKAAHLQDRNIEWVKAGRAFEYLDRPVVDRLGLKYDDTHALARVAQTTCNSIMNRIATWGGPEKIIGDLEPSRKEIIEAVKMETALTLAARRSIPRTIRVGETGDYLPDLGLAEQLREVAEGLDPRSANSLRDTLEGLTTDEPLRQSARAMALGPVVIELKKQILERTLKTLVKPQYLESVVQGVADDLRNTDITGVDSSAMISYFALPQNQQMVRGLKKEIGLVHAMLKGEIISPADTWRQQVTEERKRVQGVVEDAKGEVHACERQLEQARARLQRSDDMFQVLAGQENELAAAAESARTFEQIRRRQAALSERVKQIGAPHEVIALDVEHFSDIRDAQLVTDVAALVDKFPEIAALHGLSPEQIAQAGPYLSSLGGVRGMVEIGLGSVARSLVEKVLPELQEVVGKDRLEDFEIQTTQLVHTDKPIIANVTDEQIAEIQNLLDRSRTTIK